jgi:transcription termination factor 2
VSLVKTDVSEKSTTPIFILLVTANGPKRVGVTGEWRKLHNEELHNLYSSPSIIRIIMSRRMRWAGHMARMGEKRNVYTLLVGKPEGKKPLGRPIRWCIDNIKMDLLEKGLNVVDWIGLAQDRYRWRALVNSVMSLRVP